MLLWGRRGAWLQHMLSCSRCWEWAPVPSPPQSQTRRARILCLVLLQVVIFPALFFKYFPVLKSVCATKTGKNGKCSALPVLCVRCCPAELGAADQTYAWQKLFGKLSWVFSTSLLYVSVSVLCVCSSL